jgi:hypothetical protein
MNPSIRKICTCCHRCEKHCLCGQNCFDFGKESFEYSEEYCDNCQKEITDLLLERWPPDADKA